MKYATICSGIEAVSEAWKNLPYEAQFFSEIEPFPSAVLQHHYPKIPNLGDMEQYEKWDYRKIDIIVAGTPCQSFSVAGLRKGMVDPRGNLTIKFAKILGKFYPRWFVWENVPGVLSANKGRDFAKFLGLLSGTNIEPPKKGWKNSGIIPGYKNAYGLAYRTLDAQYFGVPQRRRRVFVVGHIGSWQRAAAVLFESHSLQGHSPPSREEGEGFTYDVAPCIGASGRGFERAGETRGQDPVVAVHTTGAGCWKKGLGVLRGRKQDSHENLLCMAHGQGNSEIVSDGDPSLTCNHEAPICFTQNSRNEIREMEVIGALAAQPAAKQQSYLRQDMQVRRLTPKECERLQGFPDDYTHIKFGRPVNEDQLCGDGHRYKALGNSMAVPVMKWLGERILEVDKI